MSRYVKHLQRQVEEEQRMRAELQDEADRIRAQVGSEESTTSGAEETHSLIFYSCKVLTFCVCI